MGASVIDQSAYHVLPPAYRGPRADILVALKTLGSLTTRELMERLRLSANAVRHHLKGLEAEGLIAARREVRGVGAPAFVWRLLRAGLELFPHRYQQLLTETLDQLSAMHGRERAVQALQARYEALGARLKSEVAELAPGERVDAVVRVLAEEGYLPEAQGSAEGDRVTLVQHHCPILAVAEQYGEVCEAEIRLLAHVLDADVIRQCHIASGGTACAYEIRFAAAAAETSPELAPLVALKGSKESS